MVHVEGLRASRHQLQVLECSRQPRLGLTAADRLLWVWFSRVRSEWRSALVLVQPAKVIIRAAVIDSVVTVTGVNAAVAGFTLVPWGSAAKYDIGVNVAIAGNASAEIAHNYIRGGRIGVNLGCASSGSTVYHNNVRGATETGINIDTCEIPPEFPGSTFNSVHHNTVCGGLFPYSIAGGQGSDFNSVHHNTGRWITLFGDGNIVHNNTAQLFNIVPGNPANVTFNNTAAAVCP